MADTPQQIQYDKDLAALNAMSGMPRVKAKEALDLKYPKGRPGSASATPGSGNAPGTAWVYDDASQKWVKPAEPTGTNKTYEWDDNKGWVESGVNTTGLTTSLGFVLSRALLDDPTYGKGVGGLQEVYDLWAAGDETAALNAYIKSNY